MIQYRADWILPVTAPPIRDGWVAVDRHRIAAVGRARAGAGGAQAIDLGRVAVLPGLVNAHTHLELSWMRGRIAPRESFPDWIRALMALRRDIADPGDSRSVAAAAAAIAEARRFGTALVGDVGNTLMPFALLAAAPVAALLFHELIGFNAPDPHSLVQQARAALDRLPEHAALRTSLAAHAPYSVAPWLFRAIRDDLDAHPFGRSTVHLAESCDEIEFLAHGTGAWRDVLEEVGAWSSSWSPPGCSPAAYLDRLGFIDARVLAVHGVHLVADDLRRLARLGATLVTCPRGNIRTGAGTPPIAAFYECGVAVAVGTDSLASVDDLNLFSELAEMRRIAPSVPAATLLESATRTGASALGFGAEFGAIEPGLRARLLAVDVPASETDVEEYLVRGIAAEQVHWLED